MRSHKETHSNDFQHHFCCVNYQKHHVNCVREVFRNTRISVDGKETAVGNDDNQDDSIEPGIDGHELNDFISEGICNR